MKTDPYQNAEILFSLCRYKEAEEILTRIITSDRYDFDALNFLGVIKLKKGDYSSAITYFQLVLQILPYHSGALYNSGYAYQKLGEFNPAIWHYKCLLELEPNHTDTLNNLGIIYKTKKSYKEAEGYFNLILGNDPKNFNAALNLAGIKYEEKNYKEAVRLYRRILLDDPENAAVIFNLGASCLRSADFLNGVRYLMTALKKDTSYLVETINLSADVIKHNSGNRQYLLEQIIPVFDEIRKSSFDYDSAIMKELKEKELFMLTELGLIKMQKGDVYSAMKFWKKARKISPGIPEINYNLAHAELLLGKFKEGWEHYEWRKKKKEYTERFFARPELIDQDVAGKTVLVYDEQGLGDTIQFVRYLKLLRNLGARIIFQYDRRLAELFKDFEEIYIHIPDRKSDLNDIYFDYHISLLSLPRYFNTDDKSIPGGIPYIRPDEFTSQKIRLLLNKEQKFNIGIVWSGNPNNTNDKKRSCPLSYFSALEKFKNVQLISLQKGKGLEQLEKINLPVINLEELSINSFAHNAVIISNLDLVISVDTSIAHLAGAIGKSVWLLLPFLPDWRWMLAREDTPWYPHTHLFRQKKPGDWEGVFDDICKKLRNEIVKKLSANTQSNFPYGETSAL